MKRIFSCKYFYGGKRDYLPATTASKDPIQSTNNERLKKIDKNMEIFKIFFHFLFGRVCVCVCVKQISKVNIVKIVSSPFHSKLCHDIRRKRICQV